MRKGTAVGRGTRLVTAAVAVALVGALLCPGPATWAQSAPVLEGTVRDAASGDPVVGAHVAVLRTTDFGLVAGALAGPDGAFTVRGLPVGSYFLYLVDPSGVHAAGFHGAPTAVATTATGRTAVEPLMNRRIGALTGTVTSDGTGTPIPGAWVALLSAATGRPEAGAVAGADGGFHLDDVAVGHHLVVVVDPAGGHRPEFHDDAASITTATTIEVTPGSTTRITPALAPVTPPGASTSSLTGHVTESETGTPIAGAWVVALDSGTLALAGGARALADGAYTLPLPTGRYLVEIVDPTGAHAVEWYDERDPSGLASATPVQVEGTVGLDEDLAVTTGTVAGTVREDESTDPVTGAWVFAIGPTGVRATTTGTNGAYRIDGLAPSTYRTAVVDASGGRGLEYSGDSPDYAGAAPVAVSAGATALADTSLAPLRCGAPLAPTPCLPTFPTPLAGPGWSRYSIATGAHSATVTRGSQATNPLAGFSTASGRRYHFLFDASAAYVLTNPTQPEDQFDWNKLPGLSDCGALDLSQNGWMFGWRWRTDLSPRRLEITAYANNDGAHLTPPTPLVTLTQAQLDQPVPLWFELAVSADRQRYEFRVAGPGSRSASSTLPRQCPTGSTTALKWASGFYFGGTSTAPSPISGWIAEG